MTELGDAFAATWRILASGDAEVLEIVALSLRVTGAAVVLAALASRERISRGSVLRSLRARFPPRGRARELGPEGGEVRRDRGIRGLLHRAEARDELATERREHGATAVGAARASRDDTAAEAAIHVVEEHPRVAIRHAERARRCRNRALRIDRLEQRDLPRPERVLVVDVNVQAKTKRHPAHRLRLP